MFDGLTAWAVGIMEVLGGPGAALVIGLDNLFPPIPSELVLPLAGFAASRGVFSYGEALFWTTLGSVAGALVVYTAGALLGRERSRALVARLPLVKVSDVDKAEEWFARYGRTAVFVGRMVPLVRSAISLPAGVERMPLVTFVALTTAGSFLWNTLFVTAGYQLGENWALVDRYAGLAQYVVVLAIVAVIGMFVARRVLAARRAAGGRAESPTVPMPPVGRRRSR